MIKKLTLVLALCAMSTQMQAGLVSDARRSVKATVKTGYEYAPLVGAIGYTTYLAVHKINHPHNISWPWTIMDGVFCGFFTGCVVKFVGSGLMFPVAQEIVKSWKRNFAKSS